METWLAKAKCFHDPHVDTDFFFPEYQWTIGDLYPTEKMIARYCADCPVSRQCESEAAKAKLDYGYWGGKAAHLCKP
jgi:hypothetical protein